MTRKELQKYLADNNLTIVAFSEQMKVSQRTVYRWLAGTTPMPKWLDLVIK